MTRLLTLVLTILVILSAPARAKLEIQEVTSPGGIKAWLVEEHSIPFVAMDIRFRGGTSLDAPGKRGAIYMMTGLLEEGAGDLDAAGFSKAAEELATSFSFDAHGDAATVTARFLTENKAASLDLLRSAMVEPRFDKDAVDRVRAQVISIIAGDAKDPREIAQNAFDAAIYGAHPYGSASTGTEESVNLLTRDDMIAAHEAVFARDRVVVAVVGDITAEELGATLDRLLGDLPETGAPLPPKANPIVEGGLTLIDYPAPQSVAVFGHIGIRRDDPDFFPAFVMNQVFGAGGFTSRLTDEVREKRGLTYSVYTYLATYDLAHLIMGSVASSNSRIAEALDVIKSEWAKLASDGVTEDELIAAKKYLTGAFPLRFDGNARIAGILAGMQLDGIPMDYIETRNDQINAVTAEDIKRVAARLMRVEDLKIVVVGQPTGLE